jgi:hypothetical protein
VSGAKFGFFGFKGICTMVTKGTQMIYRRNAKWLFSLLALIIALPILLPANALSAWDDVTAFVTFNKTRPLYNYAAKTNYFDGSLTNTSGESFQAPIRLVIDSVTTPQVTVHNADGVTDDDKPYFDFSAHLGDGTLDPGETSSAIQFEFNNPNRLRFNFTWKIWVEAGGAVEPPVNQPPVLNPITDQIIPEGGAYTYAVTAEDPDPDTMEFRLVQAPSGMAIDPATGIISWTPSEIHVGLREVTVQVSDGKGGANTQTFSLTVIATSDNTPPEVSVTCPSQVQRSDTFNIEARATDNEGVTSVSVYIDGMLVKESDGDTCNLSYNAPSEAGATISIRATALDEAKNQGDTTATVTVVEAPDTENPVITSILIPPSAAPGESVTVRAEVTDDRGVAEVRFSSEGTLFGADTAPPYEATLTMSSDAIGTITVDVMAEDTSGNTASGQDSFSVTETPDTESPTSVTIEAPDYAVAGQEIVLIATAVDNVGLLKIVFFADGVKVAEDIDAPYQVPYTIPGSKAEESQVIFTVRASDFSGNNTDSEPDYTQIIAPENGFILGEVYDDTTGLPVQGVQVKVISVHGQPLAQPMETTTDDRGQYQFYVPEGQAAIMIKKDGHSSGYRELSVLPDTVSYPLDARITPIGSGFEINRLIGGNLITPDNQIQLYVPPGTFSEDKSVTLTKLSGQGLSGLLPPGWTPLFAVHMGPEDDSLNSPLELTITGSETLVGLVGVVFDMEKHQWIRLETSASAEGKGVVISVPQMDVVAMVRPDTQPAAPAIPEVGSVLTGVALDAIPEGITADILPSPEIIFMQPGAKSFVWASLKNTQPLPSGTRIQVDFDESYERTDNTWLMPEPMTQDFVLYQGQTGFEAHFVASPSEIFDAVLLREGVIRLAAHRPEGADGTGIVGPAGGTITSPEGLSLTIPSGALASSTPVFMNAVSEADAALFGNSRFAFLQGVEVDFCGATLTASADLAVTLQETIAEDAQVLVVQALEAEGVTQYDLIAIATISGNSLTATSGSLGLPLPGIREGGRYTFLQMTEPVGYITGAVLSGGQTATNGLVNIDTLPFVSLLSSERSSYALASTISTSTVFGKDLSNGNNGTGTAEVTARAQIVITDLALTESRPTVVSVSPADDATSIAQATSVTVMFSGPMDRNTIDTASFSLREGMNSVAGAVTLMPDGTTAVFQPDNPLEDNTLYTVSLSKDITDTYGQPLFGNQPDETFISTFTTVDNTPPPLPEAGQITLSIPDDGTTEIRGTQGTVEPRTIVFIFNFTQTLSTAARAGENGSFYATLAADPGDTIEIVIQDADGDRTTLPFIPFSDNNGTTILGPQGGEMISPNGVHVSVLPKAMIRSDAVRLTDVPLEELPDNLSSGFTAIQAFHIDVSEDVFNTIQSLEIEERNNRFSGSAVYNTPLSISATHVSADSVGPTLQFGFTAKSIDVSGTEQAVIVSASGSSTPCTSQDTAEHNTSAPRISLTAPSCLGPSQAFSLAANAVQPRFDVWIEAPEGSQEGDMFLILRPIIAGGETFWIVEETATCKTIGISLRVESTFHAPWGIRDSGDYLIVRAGTPMALIEGIVTGKEALVGSNQSSLVAITDGNNGAFLLPVPADQDFELQVRLPEDGAMLSSTTIESINVNQTVQVGAVGPDAPEPLTVSVDFGQNEFVSSNSRIIFSFSQKLDTKTIVPTSLFITNSQGQKVEGSLTPVGSMQVIFSPKTAWMMGKTYTYVVTTHVRAENGAHLIQNATGTFSGFTPTVLGQVSGTDVKDAVAIGTRAYFLDSNNLRCIDILDPAQPSEGTTAILNPVPNRITSFVSDTTTALIVSAGSVSDYGKLTLFDLENPMAPSNSGSLLVSTPAASSTITGVPEQTAIPGSIATLDTQVILSNKGIGLQGLALDTISGASGNSGPGDAMLQYPLEENISFTDIASFAPWLASIGPAGLQIHDAVTLAPIATAEVNGTPLDVEVVQVDGRVLAIVAAGLSGGVQVFEISSEGQLNPVAQVLPGCSVTRIAADGPMNRAWLWCGNQRLMSLDLSHVEGMQEIDANGDDADDRLGGSIPLPITLKEITLDRPRALALISAGLEGLHVVQLGPAEAAITDVRRDPVPGDFDDEESIFSTGMVYSGDHQLFVTLETRIPPGHSGLRAVVESDAGNVPVHFSGGGTEQSLQAGTNELILEPNIIEGNDSTAFTIKVVDTENISLSSYACAVHPVPIDNIIWTSPIAETYTINTAAPMEIAIYGQSKEGRFFNISPLVEYSIENPAIGSMSSSGIFQGQGGGETEIIYQFNDQRGVMQIVSDLPPVIAGLNIEPQQVFFSELGQTSQIAFTAKYSNGITQTISTNDGIQLSSLDTGIVTVNSDGNVTAVAEGISEITAAIGNIEASIFAVVDLYIQPELTGLELDMDQTDIPTDEGYLPVIAIVRGTGTLDGLPVTFQVNGFNGQVPQVEGLIDSNGLVSVNISDLNIPGTGELTASIVNPANGETLSSSISFRVFERNRDAEPNDTLEEAIPASYPANLSGQIDSGSDLVDTFRLDLLQEGILEASVAISTQEEARLRLTVADASGSTIAENGSVSGEIVLTAPMQAESVYLIVSTETGDADYNLNLSFQPATPEIHSITPDSGQTGDIVTIEGSGFNLLPANNTVYFNGVLTEVIEAASSYLTVTVPAFATDGPLWVSTGSLISNELPFSTERQGDPIDDAFFVAPEDDQITEDLMTNGMIVNNRIRVSFRPSISRSYVETLVQNFNATIVGLWPYFNLYTFEFSDVENITELYDILSMFQQRSDVRYAIPCYLAQTEGFSVLGRDSFTDAKNNSAYEQINLFEAWDMIINSGVTNFTPAVKVAVMDSPLYINANNKPQLESGGFVEYVDLVGSTPTYAFPFSHGTMVAGIIAAANILSDKPHSTGIIGGLFPAGIPPSCELKMFNVCRKQGGVFFDYLEPAFRACTSGYWNDSSFTCPSASIRPFDIVNLSISLDFNPHNYPYIGDRDFSERTYTQYIKYFVDLFNSRPNALFVCAAGNENGTAKYRVPGCLSHSPVVDPVTKLGIVPSSIQKRVINVAAVGQGGFNDQGADTRAAFSNYGSYVDIAAPGTWVLTVDPYREGTPDSKKTKYPLIGGFPVVGMSGTSAAAPVVSGVAALMKGLDPTLTAEEIKTFLMETATPIHNVPKPTVKKHWGTWAKPKRIDALAAVQRTLERLAKNDPPSWMSRYARGHRRNLWIADTMADTLSKIKILDGFENDPSQYRVDFTDVTAHASQNPKSIAMTQSGEKAYVACNQPVGCECSDERVLNSDTILVWNTNTNSPANLGRPGSYGQLSTICLKDEIGHGQKLGGTDVKMAISPDDRLLVVPLKNRKIALIDTWRDRLHTIVDLPPFIIGEAHAVAFDSKQNLFVLTNGKSSAFAGITGALLCIPNQAGTFKFSYLTVEDPRGMAIQRTDSGEEFLYVYYGKGHPVDTAASVHSTDSLDLVKFISDNLENRLTYPLVPGSLYSSAPNLVKYKDTGTARVFDMAINGNTGQHGYLLYYWTGNIGLLEDIPVSGSGMLQRMKAVTAVNGEFEPVVTQEFQWNRPQERESFINTIGLAPHHVSYDVYKDYHGLLYLPVEFPVAMDIDQQDELIATTFVGHRGLLRMFFADKMEDAYSQIVSDPELDPSHTPLELVRPDVKYDFPLMSASSQILDLHSPRDVAFGPQISIISPRNGQTVRGAVSVNVIVCDPGINKVTCDLRGATLVSIIPHTLRNDEKLYGYIWHQDFVFTGLTAGEYTLEVTGEKATFANNEVKTRISFTYK